jgi:hypothetical protein
MKLRTTHYLILLVLESVLPWSEPAQTPRGGLINASII